MMFAICYHCSVAQSSELSLESKLKLKDIPEGTLWQYIFYERGWFLLLFLLCRSHPYVHKDQNQQAFSSSWPVVLWAMSCQSTCYAYVGPSICSSYTVFLLHSMILFLDKKMISREGLNHFRHQLTYLPLKQEPFPCRCYLDPLQGSQLHHLFSFICCIYSWLTTVCTWWGPNPFHGDWPQVWFHQDSVRDVSHTLLSCLLSPWPCLLVPLPHSPFQSSCTERGDVPFYTNPLKVDDTLYLVLHASWGEFKYILWCSHRCALPIPRSHKWELCSCGRPVFLSTSIMTRMHGWQVYKGTTPQRTTLTPLKIMEIHDSRPVDYRWHIMMMMIFTTSVSWWILVLMVFFFIHWSTVHNSSIHALIFWILAKM